MGPLAVTRIPVLGFIESVRADMRRVFRLSVFLAALVHALAVALLTQIHTPTKEAIERATRPLAVKFFIRRDPRVTKPFELRKAPQPKRRLIERQTQLAQASMDQVQSTASFNTRGLVTKVVAAPSLTPARALETGALQLEPTLSTTTLSSARAPDNKVDMALEMLDVNSMDTGRYRAMVVQDPKNRQSIKGFVNFALVVSARSLAAGNLIYGSRGIQELDRLVDMVNEYTGVKARFLGQVTYDDSRLLDVPIIIPKGVPNESEMEQLARYLIHGGFILPMYASELPNLDEALTKYGGLMPSRDFWTQRLPADHPLFTAFFEVKGGGPPSGYDGSEPKGWREYEGHWATGYFLRGRLITVTFPYDLNWSNPRTDPTRLLHMAVNIVIYALTQEGSITQRLMEMVD